MHSRGGGIQEVYRDRYRERGRASYFTKTAGGITGVGIAMTATRKSPGKRKVFYYILYEVHSTIIFPGYRVSGFTGKLRARKLDKAQTKWLNIMV